MVLPCQAEFEGSKDSSFPSCQLAERGTGTSVGLGEHDADIGLKVVVPQHW